MIKNKGFIPSTPGDIALPLKQIKAVIESFLPACTEPDMETGVPFRAQAIIANPPAYGELVKTEDSHHLLINHVCFVLFSPSKNA